MKYLLLIIASIVATNVFSAEVIKGYSTEMNLQEFEQVSQGHMARNVLGKKAKGFDGNLNTFFTAEYALCNGNPSKNGTCLTYKENTSQGLTIGGARIQSVRLVKSKTNVKVFFKPEISDGKTLVEAVYGKYGQHEHYNVKSGRYGITKQYFWFTNENEKLEISVFKGIVGLSIIRDLVKDGDSTDF